MRTWCHIYTNTSLLFCNFDTTESGERVLFLATPRFPAHRRVEEEGEQASMEERTDSAAAAENDVEIAMGMDGIRGGGAYAVNWDGETVSIKKVYKKVQRRG